MRIVRTYRDIHKDTLEVLERAYDLHGRTCAQSNDNRTRLYCNTVSFAGVPLLLLLQVLLSLSFGKNNID